ncbi:hypothetical protein, partial [Comamonas aquatica]|uniref:hypothetical protein n=1 Tax=Comamonas aquatica TaxID=225991 RepID=UPI00391A8619
VDVQSVPRFTLLEHYGSQVYQKRKPSALAFMGSLCNATTPLGVGVTRLKLDLCNSAVALCFSQLARTPRHGRRSMP